MIKTLQKWYEILIEFPINYDSTRYLMKISLKFYRAKID